MTGDGTRERSVWRNRDFRLLISGQVVSFVGDQAQLFALPLLVLATFRSATQAGFALGLGTVSYLVFGLVAGALADRWDRKRTMIWCEAARAVLIGSLVLAIGTHHLTLTHVYLVSVAAGMLATLFESASRAALPNVVGADQLAAALGYSQSANNTVRIAGATVAGALYALGRAVPFGVNAVSFAVSALSLRLMRARFQQDRTAPPRRLAAEIADGIGWVWHRPVIRFLSLVEAGGKLRYGAGYLLIIVLAKQVGATPVGIGLIFTGAAVGALLGSLLSGQATKRFPLGRIAVVMLWIEALSFPLYALAPNPAVLGVVAGLESVVAPVYGVAMTTYRLAITPDGLRGKTTSAVSTLTTGAMSVGTLVGGALLTWLGARHLTFALSGWMVLLAGITTINPAVRRAPVATRVGSDDGLPAEGVPAQDAP